MLTSGAEVIRGWRSLIIPTHCGLGDEHVATARQLWWRCRVPSGSSPTAATSSKAPWPLLNPPEQTAPLPGRAHRSSEVIDLPALQTA